MNLNGLVNFLHPNRLNNVLFNDMFFVHHLLQNLNVLANFLHTNRLDIVLFNEICFCVCQILQNLNGRVNFLHTNRLDIVLFNDTICFLCASNFAMNLNAVSSKTETPLYMWVEGTDRQILTKDLIEGEGI